MSETTYPGDTDRFDLYLMRPGEDSKTARFVFTSIPGAFPKEGTLSDMEAWMDKSIQHFRSGLTCLVGKSMHEAMMAEARAAFPVLLGNVGGAA